MIINLSSLQISTWNVKTGLWNKHSKNINIYAKHEDKHS